MLRGEVEKDVNGGSQRVRLRREEREEDEKAEKEEEWRMIPAI